MKAPARRAGGHAAHHPARHRAHHRARHPGRHRAGDGTGHRPGHWPGSHGPGQGIRVTVTGAVVTSLENNASLRVERTRPVIARTFEEQERAVFDPVLSAMLQQSRARADSFVGKERFSTLAEGPAGLLSMNEFLPTGTTVNASLDTARASGVVGTEDSWTTRLGATVTQSLLQGAGVDVNLATLRQVTLDTLTSEYNLRGFAESLVAQTEEAYWDDVLARRQIEIFESSLDLAKKQADDTRERIKVGKLAETELAAAEAEIATREEGLIDARSALATTNLLLLRLLNPPGANPFRHPVGPGVAAQGHRRAPGQG